MRILRTKLDGVFIIEGYKSQDERGEFFKIYNESMVSKYNIKIDMKESYYSVSNKGVLRGMHFQSPPHEHNKLVTVIKGSITDVILDLRKSSRSYKKFITVNLRGDESKAVFIPIGCAHGFLSLENETITLYNVSSEYNKDDDSGVKFDSFGYKWMVDNPIISDRDNGFVSMNDFESPF